MPVALQPAWVKRKGEMVAWFISSFLPRSPLGSGVSARAAIQWRVRNQ